MPALAQQPPKEEARFGVITDFELHFAQFGGGDGFSSDIVLTNPSTFFAASGTIDFFDASGQPLEIELVDDEVEGAVSSVNFELAPAGGLRLRTDSSRPIALGSATLTSGDLVGGVIRFRIPNVGIAGVPASQPLEGAIVPFRQQDGVRTALAVRNLMDAGNLIVTLSLRDFDGVELPGGFFALALQPHARSAEFIDEIFDELDLSGFEGVVVMEAEGPFAATALELGDDAGEFTTLPVTPLPDVILLNEKIAEVRRQMPQGNR
ncbi:MAG TPA: hypothetical protein VLU25_20530 [Acidobacteriota bacterium]|nr:hypothetical protein [Acidobacteriota bacterium]